MEQDLINSKTLRIAAIVGSFVCSSAFSGTIDDIKKKGYIQCGVSGQVPGFSSPDSKGVMKGLDADTCRAVAAAVLGDSKKVKFTQLSAQQRFTALQSGEVDILARNTTHTLSRDTALGLNFAPITFYDGQGFMVRKKSGIKSGKDLEGATVCVQQGTTTERNITDYFRKNGMKFKAAVYESRDETLTSYLAKRCDVYTTDASGLAAERTKLKDPQNHVILPERISKEPLGPAVRHGDDQWFDAVKFTIYALFAAEEMGITSANIDSDAIQKSTDPNVQKLLGNTVGNGKSLGLTLKEGKKDVPNEKWSYNAIKQVGNYAEIYERNVGPNTPLKLDRGLNALYTNGGLMYAPPIK